LEEAREIAQRGDMKLHLADYHLERARLARSEKDKEKMAEHYGQAKRLIEECGYHRRDGEVRDLENEK
jgi:transposase